MNNKKILKGLKLTKGSKNFITAWGNFAISNMLWKSTSFILLFVVLILSYLLKDIVSESKNIRPLPIFINNVTGTAIPVDYKAIDAKGNKRHASEVRGFVKDYLSNLYTFSKLTAKSNLVQVEKVSTEDVYKIIKNMLIRQNRYDKVKSKIQGLCEVKPPIIILESLPDLKVQVFFDALEYTQSSEEPIVFSHVSILRIKTVVRSIDNPHGLFCIEYRDALDTKARKQDNINEK